MSTSPSKRSKSVDIPMLGPGSNHGGPRSPTPSDIASGPIEIPMPSRTRPRVHTAGVQRHFGHSPPTSMFFTMLEPPSQEEVQAETASLVSESLPSPRSEYSGKYHDMAALKHSEMMASQVSTNSTVSAGVHPAVSVTPEGTLKRPGFDRRSSSGTYFSTTSHQTLPQMGTRITHPESPATTDVAETDEIFQSSNQLASSLSSTLGIASAAANNVFDYFMIVSLITNTADQQRQQEDSDNELAREITVSPEITYRFPSADDTSVPEMDPALLINIPLFCFPEIEASDSRSNRALLGDYIQEETVIQDGETFGFTLTDSMHHKRFGYCKRFDTDVEVECDISVSDMELNKSGSPMSNRAIYTRAKRLQTAYCIVSSTGSSALFHQILSIAELRMKQYSSDTRSLTAFLEAVMMYSFPKPGRSLLVRVMMSNSKMDEYELFRPVVDTTLENVSFTQLFDAIGLKSAEAFATMTPKSPFDILIILISAILSERHIILTSQSLHKLSHCTSALNALTHPLEWQHIFIPILPRKLIEFVCSPIPSILGMLTTDVIKIVGRKPLKQSSVKLSRSQNLLSSASTAADEDLLPVDEALVFNLDTGQILRHDTAGTDRSVIPIFLINKLRDFLRDAFKKAQASQNMLGSIASSDNTSPNRQKKLDKNALISDAMLKFFVMIIGPYRDYMTVTNTIDPITVTFDYETFVKEHPLVRGDINSVWLRDLFPDVPATSHNGGPTSTSASQKRSTSFLPSKSQRMQIQSFLKRMQEMHNFQFFVQQREEAFQYHYQTLMDKARGQSASSSQQQQSSTRQDESRIKKSNADSLELAGTFEGAKKTYRALSKSKFERVVSQYDKMRLS